MPALQSTRAPRPGQLPDTQSAPHIDAGLDATPAHREFKWRAPASPLSRRASASGIRVAPAKRRKYWRFRATSAPASALTQGAGWARTGGRLRLRSLAAIAGSASARAIVSQKARARRRRGGPPRLPAGGVAEFFNARDTRAGFFPRSGRLLNRARVLSAMRGKNVRR